MPPKRRASNQASDEPPANRRRTRATAATLPSSPLADTEQTPRASRIKRPAPKPSPTKSHVHDSPTSKPTEKRVTRSRAKVAVETPHEVPSSDPEADGSDDELLLTPSKSRSKKKPPPPTRSAKRTRVYVEILSPANRLHKPAASKTVLPPASPTPTRPRSARKKDISPPPQSPPSPTPFSKPSSNRIGPPKRLKPHTPVVVPPRTPGVLPENLLPCLHAQKRAILNALFNPKTVVSRETNEDGEPSANAVALEQLEALLTGTMERGEGNSCLLIGPRGSGKSRLLDTALASLSPQPILIRLSGHVQHNDRLALREIARQLAQQTGQTFNVEAEVEGDDDLQQPIDASDAPIALPPPSHLPTLISALPTLARSTVIVLESFDLFADHGRQALLYCLLDTAQSCRAGKDSRGIAVIGVTTRIDTINLLEKRVKSRFSGRMLRTAGPETLKDWEIIVRNALSVPLSPPNAEWEALWSASVDKFLADRTVKEEVSHTYSLTKDVRLLNRILMDLVLNLSPTSASLSAAHFTAAATSQRYPDPLPFLSDSSYPAACLLIAAVHAGTAGHDSVTFEMLHDSFQKQVRTSQSAPVQVEGGGIGMMRCSKDVLMTAFEQLVATKVFAPIGPASAGTVKQFVRYKCMVEREDVKKMVDAIGQTNLKKWFNRAQ